MIDDIENLFSLLKEIWDKQKKAAVQQEATWLALKEAYLFLSKRVDALEEKIDNIS